jgi:hypothetical protein
VPELGSISQVFGKPANPRISCSAVSVVLVALR